MCRTKIIILLLCSLLMAVPHATYAFWGSDGDKQNGLNLESGYDANTVMTVSGRIVFVQTGDERRNAQIEIENGGVTSIVVLGPQRYWAEKGIALKVGDEITVRGSKAQGTDGVVYILAQKLTDTSLKASISLRNESGRPAWAGGGMGSGAGLMTNRPTPMRQQQSPGRMGNGRLGR
jgi:hypothetical protein